MRAPNGEGNSTGVRLRRAVSLPEALPTLVLAVAFVASFALSVYLTKDMWFSRDDWSYLMQRGTIDGQGHNWFYPYGGHWVTGPVIMYRTLFAVFGMHYYLPYALMSIGLHLVIAALLHPILLRAGANRWVAVAMTCVVLFLGAGAEGFLWDAASPLLGSMALGLAAVLVLQRTGFSPRGRLVATGLLMLGMMFSGAGITAGCLAFFFAAGSRGLRTAVQLVAPAALLFLVWYVAIGHTGSSPAMTDRGGYLTVPLYVWTGLTGAMGNASGIPGAGPVIVVGLLVGLLVLKDIPIGLRHLALAGVFAAVLQLTLSGITRLQFGGVELAASGRYAFLVVVLLAPGVAACLGALRGSVVREPRVAHGVLAVLLLVAYVLNGASLERQYSKVATSTTSAWEGRVRGILLADDEGQRILTPRPEDWLDGDIDARLVTDPVMRRALPERKATPEERLDAERIFFVGVGTDDFDLFRPATVTFQAGFTSPFRPGNQCSGYQSIDENPVLVLETGAGNEISVKSEATKIATRLERNGVSSDDREWAVEPGVVHIATTAKDARLTVAFDSGGDFVICTN